MPYIKQGNRQGLLDGMFENGMPITPGDLNFVITTICIDYMNYTGGQSYTKMNEIIGALECAKLEFYRRAVSPYEDKKIEENGDVY